MRPEPSVKATTVPHNTFGSLAAIFFALLFAALTLNSWASAAPPPPQSTYDSASFSQELKRLRENLEPARKSTDALRAYREALPKSWPLDVGGRHFDVPAQPLASHVVRAEREPAERRKELDQAQAYLDSLIVEAPSFSGEPQPATRSARSKLDAILARPEYAHIKQQSWYDKLRERINEFLLNLLERFFSRVGSQETFGYVLLWLGLAASAVLIAYWVFGNWFRAARTAEMALGGAAVPARSWQEWVFAAREAAARADYRVAVHCAHWAGIARLQDIGALSSDRAKTPREYLRALTSGKAILARDTAVRRQALAHMTSRLENTWYGHQLATEADFRDSLAQLETLGCHLP